MICITLQIGKQLYSLLRALMPVVCVDTAVYALSIDYYHYNFPMEDPAQLGSPDAYFVDKVVSMLGTYFLALSQEILQHCSRQCISAS